MHQGSAVEAGCGAGTGCAQQRHQPQCGVQCLQSGWTDAVAQRSAGSTGEGRSASQPLPRWCKMTIPAQVMNPSDEASESPSANATCSGIPTFRS
eukprot:s145_g29.t2